MQDTNEHSIQKIYIEEIRYKKKTAESRIGPLWSAERVIMSGARCCYDTQAIAQRFAISKEEKDETGHARALN